MRYTDELAARAEAWLARPLENSPAGKRSAEGLLELATIWAATQNVPLPDCLRQCQYSERARAVAAYVREYHRFISSPDAMSDSQYTFAPQFAGETIADGRYNKTVTAENITDDDAKALLKLGYDHVIVKKGASPAPAAAASSGDAGTEPSAAEKKATEAATKAQKEASETKAALKAEKDAHKATAKELTDTKKLLAEATEKLAKAQEATKPEADAPQSDTAAS